MSRVFSEVFLKFSCVCVSVSLCCQFSVCVRWVTQQIGLLIKPIVRNSNAGRCGTDFSDNKNHQAET